MGVELPLCVFVTLSGSRMLCHVFWSQVEYKIVCFITDNYHLSTDDFQVKVNSYKLTRDIEM